VVAKIDQRWIVRVICTLFISSSLLLASAANAATTLNVDLNDAGCNDGTGTPYCTIGVAVIAAAAGDTVSVAPGVYVENVVINKNLFLVSTGGRAVTTIRGISSAGALGTVQIVSPTTAVEIGGSGAGFKIEGIDNGAPGIENAAIYVRGTHSGARILDNEIVAVGEAGLLSEYGATISGFLVDGNIFSGKTFIGAVPGGCGFGTQFSTPNVPRQLATMGGGLGGGNTSNTTFTNNIVIGTAGGTVAATDCTIFTGDDVQGNTLVTVDSNGASIGANTFAGTTSRYATSLRARGPSTTISGNSFSGTGLLPVACHVSIDTIGSDLVTVAAANTFDTLLGLFPDALAVDGVICPLAETVEDIDIKPGSDPNSINTKSNGVIPVALLGSALFNVTLIDVTTLAFGPSGASLAHDLTDLVVLAEHLQDVNTDGFTDLVSHYRQKQTGLAVGATEACLTAELTGGGGSISGCDSVNVVK
jgi:hypothetical protein